MMRPVKRALDVRIGERRAARSVAAWSAAALDRPLAADAELGIAVVGDAATVLGAFQRTSEIAAAGALPVLRRGSGGAAFDVTPGAVWMVLALREPSSLVPCDAPRLMNRYVRPLLRALTRVGALSHYFGRDWVSSAKQPVAHVAFAYDAGSGRSTFEALLGTDAPFSAAPRTSFDGKAPVALRALAPRVEVPRLVETLASAYEELARSEGVGVTRGELAAVADAPLVAPSTWEATREEALGVVGASREGSRLAVGGALCVARDALRAFEDALAGIDPQDEARLAQLVDTHLGAPEAALFGVRSLASLRDAVAEAALRTTPGAPTRA